jgi:hypothetical protein
VSDERDAQPADRLEERHARQDIQHALLELTRLPVVEAKAGHPGIGAGGKRVAKLRVDGGGGSVESAERAADEDRRARPSFARVQDADQLAARRVDRKIERGVVARMRRDSQYR